jgi:hypothetical protein
MNPKKSKLASRAERILRKNSSDDPARMKALRAKWADATLKHYTQTAGEKPRPGMTKAQRLDLKRQNLSDLLCQLAHLCDRDGIDFMSRLHVAAYHYREEAGRKGKQLPPPPAKFPKPSPAALSGAVRDFVKMAAAGNTEADDLQKLACDLLGRKHPAKPAAKKTPKTAALRQAIATWRKAADGDSDDAEHDAGHELADLAESFLNLASPNTRPDLLTVCKATLQTLENITTDAFSKGGDKALRDALKTAIDNAASAPTPNPLADPSNLATVLCALRLFQREYEGCEAKDIYEAWPDHFPVVDGKQPEPLGTDDIDTLCEELNCGPAQPPAPPDSKQAAYIAQARSIYANDDLEIDDQAALSEVNEAGQPKGAWVAAWVWVNKEEATPEPEDLDHPQTDEHLAVCPECMRNAVNAATETRFGISQPEEDPEVAAAKERARAVLDPISEPLTLPAPPRAQVVIEINEGVANIHTCPENIDVMIVDWDMFECGDHTLTGENAIDEELRAWIEANEPEWYAEQLQRETAIAEEKIPLQTRKARAGMLPHDTQNDEPEEAQPCQCSHKGCTTMVNPEDPYYATPCGTYCSTHMREHLKSCEICRNEFTD